MKIEVEITKTRFFFIIGVVAIVGAALFVQGYNTNNPSAMGHTVGEINWADSLSQLNVAGATSLTGDVDIKVSNTGAEGAEINLFPSQSDPSDPSFNLDVRHNGASQDFRIHRNGVVLMSLNQNGDISARDIVWFGNIGGWLRDGAITPSASCSYTTGSSCSATANGQSRKVNGVLETRAWMTGGCAPCNGLDSGWVAGHIASVSGTFGSVQCGSFVTAGINGVSVGGGSGGGSCSASQTGW